MSVESAVRRVLRAGGAVVRPQAIRFVSFPRRIAFLCLCMGVGLCHEFSMLCFKCFFVFFGSDKTYVESVVSFLHEVVPQVCAVAVECDS